MQLETRISIMRPPQQVWDYFTNAAHWKHWWGGALKRVDPGWQKGASMVWELGRPSDIANVIPVKQVDVTQMWSNVTWSFSNDKGSATLVRYKEEFTGGATMDPVKWQAQFGGALAALKRAVESTPAASSAAGDGQKRVPWFKKLFGNPERD